MANRNGGFIGTDGLDAPDPPTAVTPTAGNAQVSVAFTAPTDTGTSAITGFVAQVSTDGTDYSAGSNTGSSSPIVVTSLTNGTAATAKVWAINAYGTSAPSDASSSFTPAIPDRAIYAGGSNASAAKNVIEYLDINSSGNMSDFGDLSAARDTGPAGLGSSTRGIIAGGTGLKSIDYITIASTGNAQDFGDLLDYQSETNQTARAELGGGGNETRGIIVGAAPLSANGKIDYITIASLGNSTNFGETLSNSNNNQCRGAGSTTRFIYGAFQSNKDQIEYITIASTGNGTNFGDLGSDQWNNSAVNSSATRCCWAGGGTRHNEIRYVTISTLGNGTDFGDLLATNTMMAAASNKTKGLMMGGSLSGNTRTNVVQQITIASTGNSTDYGDLDEAKRQGAGLSNAHGGLS